MPRSQRSRNLSEEAYEQIKNDLIKGKISTGDILSESQLASQFGMSRTPIREAFRALESEGWLEIKNGIGAYVKPLSTKDMEDLYEVRCLLEVHAARTAIHYITYEEINNLEQQFRKLLDESKNHQSPDPHLFSELDWSLHELIVDRCRNDYIKHIMRNNTANMKRYQVLSIEAVNDIEKSTMMHLNILSLIRKRDVDALCDALQQHLQWAASFLTIPRQTEEN